MKTPIYRTIRYSLNKNAQYYKHSITSRVALSVIAVVLFAGLSLGSLSFLGGQHSPSAAALSLPDTNYDIPAAAIFVAPNGDDTAGGSQDNPLKTIPAALAKVGSGGTVILRGGTYYDVALGDITKQVTIQPYPHEAVWLKGSVVVKDWTSDGTSWRHDGWTTQFCQTCFNTQAIDSSHPNAGLPDQVFINNQPLQQVTSKDAVTAGTFFVDQSAQTLYIGNDPTNALVEASTQWRALQLNAGSEGSVVRGIGFAQYAPNWNENQLAAVISNAANVTFDNDAFVQSAGTSLGIFQPDNKLLNSIISDNGYRGAIINKANNTIVTGNSIERNNTEGFNIDSCGLVCTAAGIKATHSDNFKVTDNYIRDNNSAGLWCDLGCTNASLTRNVVTGNKESGLYYEVSSKAIIASNLLTNNGRGLKISGSDHVRVYNNTFSRNRINIGVYDDGRSSSEDTYSANLGLTWDTTNTEIRNNLFANNNGSDGSFYDSNAQQVNAAQMIDGLDHNAWYRTDVATPATLITWCLLTTGCTQYQTLASFSAATGFETTPGSIAVDNTASHPFFVNEAANDYNLNNTSPAIKAGAALPQDIADAIGVAAAANPNMGALRWPGKQFTTPSVTLTAPSSGKTVSGTAVALAATAADSSDISSVTFKINDTTLGVATTAPYGFHWDTTKLANGSYTISAIATNTSGRTATASVPVTVYNAPPVITLNLTPTDDATISQAAPTTKYGTATTLTAGDKTRRDFLMKFSVSGLNGRTVKSATLKLYATEAAASGLSMYGAQHNNWTQSAVTWNLAPWINQPALATMGKLTAKTTYTINLAGLIKADGVYSIRALLPNSDVASFSSRDSTTNKPQLIVTAQ